MGQERKMLNYRVMVGKAACFHLPPGQIQFSMFYCDFYTTFQKSKSEKVLIHERSKWFSLWHVFSISYFLLHCLHLHDWLLARMLTWWESQFYSKRLGVEVIHADCFFFLRFNVRPQSNFFVPKVCYLFKVLQCQHFLMIWWSKFLFWQLTKQSL